LDISIERNFRYFQRAHRKSCNKYAGASATAADAVSKGRFGPAELLALQIATPRLAVVQEVNTAAALLELEDECRQEKPRPMGRALQELSYTSWLAEMNQEDYVCGSLQFSIRPKAGWVVWKQKNMPFETSQIVSWAPILHTPLPFNPIRHHVRQC